MISFKDRELLDQFLSSPLIRNHKITQQILDGASAESVLLKERITEIRNILNSDYISTDYDLIEMMSRYFDPMHVFTILSYYVDPNRLINELLTMFRLRGSETIKNLLFEVFLKYYNLSAVTDYEKGELIIDSTYDLERFIDYYYKNGKYIDLNIMDTVRLLCRELLVGGHKLRLTYLGVLIELSNIDNTDESWYGKFKIDYNSEFSNLDDILRVSPIITDEINPPSSAGYALMPVDPETLNNEWRVNKSFLNEFDGKRYVKIDKDQPELKKVIVNIPLDISTNELLHEVVLEPGRDIQLDEFSQDDYLGENIKYNVLTKVTETHNPSSYESLVQVIIRDKLSDEYDIETILSNDEPSYYEVASDINVGSVVQISSNLDIDSDDN